MNEDFESKLTFVKIFHQFKTLWPKLDLLIEEATEKS